MKEKLFAGLCLLVRLITWGDPPPGGDRNSHSHDAPGASGGCNERE